MIRASVAAFLLAGSLATPVTAEVLRMGGTGMALGAMTRIAEHWSSAEAGVTAQVLPSLGTSGGIKALKAGAIDIAFAARGASEAEKSASVVDALCLKTAFIFATSRRLAGDLPSRQLPALYAARRPVWPDGSPLKIILRPRSGSEVPYLAERVPGMAAALDIAFEQPERPITLTDQENAQLAVETPDVLAMLTLLQLRGESLALTPLSLDGVAPSAASLADGSYSLPLRLCLLTPAAQSPLARRFVAHLRTRPAQVLLNQFGAVLE